MVSATFASLVGQSQAVELLTRAITQARIAPAYLFAGAAGIGRSLAARCFVQLLLSSDPLLPPHPGLQQRIQQGNHPDLLWVEPTYLHQGKRVALKEAIELGLKRKTPPQIRLEQVREITQFLGRSPLEASRSVVVLEQAETMAESAANALLKTLEEPGNATLILLAPSIDALLPTLVSRCQRIPFQRLSQAAIAQVLHQNGHSEILQQPEVLALAQGSPGAAIAHWQQLEEITPELLESIRRPPGSIRQALELARQITSDLDIEAQLWLVDYLQQSYWQCLSQHQLLHPGILQQFESARRALLHYAQERLVWEVMLIAVHEAFAREISQAAV
jgi:DNA polymerase III subunit delta'